MPQPAGAGKSGAHLGDFFQKLAARIRPAGTAPTGAALCLFGKHPGWDDHMEDIGPQSREMLDFKRMLYVEGVGGNIDAGNWAHLPTGERLAEFNHLLIFSRDDYYILATLSASADGKGRNLYPLVAAVQARGVSLADLGRHIGPLLLEMRSEIQKTASAAGAQSLVRNMQERLGAIGAGLAPGAPRLDRMVTGHQAARLFSADASAAAPRVLYAVQRAVEAVGHDPATARTETVRVPLESQQPWFAARIWCALIRSMLGSAGSVMVAEYRPPDGATGSTLGFVDLIIGNPGQTALFCLRAGLNRIPLASDIPYSLDAPFVKRVADYLTACRSAGDGSAPAFFQ